MSLKREIEDLLAVEPSPEFVAKVRQRIAAEASPPSLWLSWRHAVAAIGLAAVVGAALLWPSAGPVAPRDAEAIAPINQRPGASASEASVAPVASGPSPRRAFAAPNRQASSPVLIERDEAKAMDLLLTRIREGALPDMAEALAAVDAAGPEWIAIHPVRIEPIATEGGE
jgi:hypothetical protein